MTRGPLILLLGHLLLLPCGGCVDAPTLGPGVFCNPSTPCASDPNYPLCNPFSHQCVAADAGMFTTCSASTGCPEDLPVCDTTYGACARCASSADDTACQSRDATRPRCLADTGRCAACRTDTVATDCTVATAPFCDHGSCRGCRAHTECASAVCNADGSCASAADIVYVDNAGGKCAGQHTGTKADPYCEIEDAVTAIGMRKMVRVAGSAVAYHRVEVPLDAAAITLIGPGRDATPPATLKDVTGPCFNLLSVNAVTIDGFELTGCMGGIYTLGPTLVLLRSYVHDNNGIGVETHFGADTNRIDASIISRNTGGGVAILGANPGNGKAGYDVENCFISENSGKFGGVRFGGGSNGRFAFNTVRKNLATDVAGGVACEQDGQQRILESSIIVENAIDANQFQMSMECMLLNVVAGSGETHPGAWMVNPAWREPLKIDYHLLGGPGINPKIIDAVHSDMNDHDIDGTKRPQGAGWDIGAQEVVSQ